MQANITYKGYYARKAYASKLKERDYVYVLQLKADHQGSKTPLTDWTGAYIVEKSLSGDNYLVSKIEGDKRQPFIACECDLSDQKNRHPTYRPRHKYRNATLKLH